MKNKSIDFRLIKERNETIRNLIGILKKLVLKKSNNTTYTPNQDTIGKKNTIEVNFKIMRNNTL